MNVRARTNFIECRELLLVSNASCCARACVEIGRDNYENVKKFNLTRSRMADKLMNRLLQRQERGKRERGREKRDATESARLAIATTA